MWLQRARRSPQLVNAGEMLLTMAICYLAGRLSLGLAFLPQGELRTVTAVWLPGGVALGLMLLWGRQVWPGVWVGVFAVQAAAYPGWVAAALAVASTLEAVAGQYLLVETLGFDNAMERVVDVLGFVTLGAGVSALVGATLGIAILVWSGLLASSLALTIWGMWWLGSVVGVLLAGPLLLTWTAPAAEERSEQFGEVAALVLALAVIGYAVYGGLFPAEISAGLAYAVFPVLIWAAVRTGQRGAVSLNLLISAIALMGTLAGLGPFARTSSYRSLLNLDGFLVATTIATMLLAAAIAERQKAQEAALRSEQKLRGVIRQSGDAIILANDNGDISEWNLSAERMLGWSRDAVMGRPVWDVQYELTPPGQRTQDTLANLRSGVWAVLGNPGLLPQTLTEDEILRPDGKRRVVQSLSFPIGTERGAMMGIIARDVTAQRHADRILREHAARLATLMENLQMGILVSDTAGRVIIANSSFCRLFGLAAPGEILGTAVLDVWHTLAGQVQEGDALLARALESMDDLAPVLGENWVLADDRVIESDHVPIHVGGDLFEQMWLFRDVTRRVRVEEQLRQTQRVEAIGRLAGGVAHEVNNQLTVIIGYAQMLAGGLPAEDPRREDLEEIHHAGERAANLAEQLLAFGRRQMAQPMPIDINMVIEQMDNLLHRLVGEDVALDINLDENGRTVFADQGQIEQILLNLIVNARDACQPGDRVAITTRTETLTPADCRGRPEARAGTFVCLTVRDTGSGMDADVRGHLFEPFFSTKPEGSGLGLAVVYGLVKQHNGWIEVDSAPEGGSTFRLYLPTDDRAATVRPRQMGTPDAHPGRDERLLLVEDEEGVRRMAARMLRRSGYRIVEAGSAEEALSLYDADTEGFDLVFSDVVLTGRSGVQLVADLRQQDPGLRVVLTSGYADQKSQWEVIRDRGYPFLPKPYPLAELLRLLREVLDEPPPG